MNNPVSYSGMFWPFIRLLLAFGAVLLSGLILIIALAKWRRCRRHAKLLLLGIDSIDSLTGRDFEHLVSALFTRMGYKIELTPYVGDWGADVVVSKQAIRTVIQAKRWKKTVGVRAVKEVLGAKGKYKAQRTLVIASNFYTRQAKSLARAIDVELWDRERLQKELESLATSRS